MASPSPLPAASLIVREQSGEPFFEAKFRHAGRQVKRRIGPAWLTQDRVNGEWRPRRGRVADGSFDKRRAHVAAAEVVERYIADLDNAELIAAERQARGVSFREVALAYLGWLEHVRGARPSTIKSHGSQLAERGTRHRSSAHPPRRP